MMKDDMKPVSDEALIHQACKELPYVTLAFETLMQRYESDILRIAAYRMGNHDDGLEVTQEAMLKVFFHLKKFKGKSTFKTWLYRIVFNVCHDTMRKSRPETVELSNVAELRSWDDTLSPVLDKITMEKLLMLLDEQSKEIVLLRLSADLSFQEVADACDMGLSAVKMRYARAIAQLQQHLQ